MYYGEYGGDAEYSFPRALSVSEINEFIKRLFDGVPQFANLSVQGEISNFKNHFATGHFYFTLKDENSAIKAVMFRTFASQVKFKPENGMKVTVHGRISAYPRDGQYQIYCDRMEPLGVGALYAAYEQLKKKLGAEGLFDESHKRPLPHFPKNVGVITSESGAAVRDIINVAGRRWPIARIILYPALVQGDGAAASVISGIDYFNANMNADVLIIGRGGGSIEDLWAFNNEELARTIYNSKIPVISAVGHETDFTISDFVSDVRAPTPSVAAEIALPDITEIRRAVASLDLRQKTALSAAVKSKAETLKRYSEKRVLKDPMAFIDDRILQLGGLSDKLKLLTEHRLIETQNRIASSNEKLKVMTEQKLRDLKNKLSVSSGKLDSLSPLAVLSRGYGAVTSDGGKIIKSVRDVAPGDRINVRLRDGALISEVKDVDAERK